MKTVNHGFESLRYLGLKIWETIRSHLKEIDSLKKFKVPSKNGNQKHIHGGSAKYIFEIHGTCRFYIKKITYFF